MSPEYVIKGIISTKTDVFSYGVLVLEIVSGKKNNSRYQADYPLNLIGFVSNRTELRFVCNIIVLAVLLTSANFVKTSTHVYCRHGNYGMKVKVLS